MNVAPAIISTALVGSGTVVGVKASNRPEIAPAPVPVRSYKAVFA
jgi:hypothetical protein